MTISHAQARDIIIEAFERVFDREPTLLEAQFAQAWSLGESWYGQAKFKNRLTGESRVINNWGSVQCVKGPPCDGDCFEVTDTREDGTPYQWCYRVYATPADGAVSFIKTLYVSHQRHKVLKAANTGSIELFAETLRASRYFELGLSKAIKGLTSNLQKITSALGEPMPSPKELVGDKGAEV